MKTGKILVFLMMALAFGLLTSCDDDSSGPDNNVPCNNLDELLDLAYLSLETQMAALMADDSEDLTSPSDIDLSITRGLYQDAYDCDNTNAKARAGLAFTDIMSMTQDDDANQVFDDWSTYLDEGMPFEVPNKMMVARFGLASLMNRTLTKTSYDLAKMFLANRDKSLKDGDEPQIGDVQNIIWNDVLPKVKAARVLLEAAAADPDFEFIVSGRMMGDELADDIEVDQTDMQVFLAGVRIIESAIYILTAYDLDMASFDDDGILASLDQDTGNMLTLRTGAAANLALVPGLFQAAIDDLTDAINNLLSEIDDQDNDLLTLELLDFDGDELAELRDDILPDIRAAMDSGGFDVVQDWDFDEETDDTSVTVDLNAFFNDPIDDWKQIFPPYDLTIENVPCGTEEFDSAYLSETATMDVPGYFLDSYVYLSIDVTQFDNIEVDEDDDYFPAFETACLAIVDDILADLNLVSDWSGNMEVYFNASGFTAGATVTVDIYYDYEYTTTDTWLYAPMVSFDDAGDAWFAAIPNPDLNGLLPDFDSGTDYQDLFNLDGSIIPQEFLLNWGELCDGDIGFVKSVRSDIER